MWSTALDCMHCTTQGGNAFSASVPSTFISFFLKEETFYKEGGKTLGEVAQRSLGYPHPGSVQPF